MPVIYLVAFVERDQLIEDLKTAEQDATSYNQRVLMLEKGGEVDRRSTEGLRQNMVDLRGQIATLQEEVAFYKGIMAPSSRKHDLRIQGAGRKTFSLQGSRDSGGH